MNGLFGFGLIDTLVKLSIFILIWIMVLLIKKYYTSYKNNGADEE